MKSSRMAITSLKERLIKGEIKMPKEMIFALTVIFGLFCLMIVRTIWLLKQENKSKRGVKSYFKYPMTMSIGERMKRKHIPFKW